MKFQGVYLIPAPPEVIWAALHDPEILTASMPGRERVERKADGDFHVGATLSIGTLKTRFGLTVRMMGQTPPPGFTHAGVLTGEAQGAAAGSVHGECELLLAADGADTRLTYTANVALEGGLAQVAPRTLDSTAKSLADDFFAKFTGLMRSGTEAVTRPALPRPGGTEAPQIWIAGLMGVIVILLIGLGIVLQI